MSLPLHLAASRGNLDEVQRLVSEGASLGLIGEDGLTPLMQAVHNNHEQVAVHLVKEMAGPDLALKDIFGYNILHYLAREGHPWALVMEIVCEKCPDAIQMVNYKGRRPIDVAREKLDDNPEQSEYKDVIHLLDQHAQYQVKKGIAEKMVQTCNITITFIGNVGSGKTCLRKQLSREEFPVDGPESTNVVEFLANYLDWDPITGFRQKLGEGGEEETGIERLRRIFKRYSAQKSNTNLNNPNQHDVSAKLEVGTSSIQMRSIPLTNEGNISNAQQEMVGEILYQYEDHEYWYDTQYEDDFTSDPEDDESKHLYEELVNAEGKETKEKESDTVSGFITLYDFGGETVFYNTHHCFMSGDMVFILVFDVAKCVDSEKRYTEIGSIETWLCSVGTYAVDDNDGKRGTPPIILVGSHLDQVSGTEEEKFKVFGSILDQLYQNRRIRRIMEKHVYEMFPISNLNDTTQHKDLYETIWRKLFEVAPFQSEWMKLVPARWIAIEQELLKRKGQGLNMMTYQDVMDLNRELLVPLSDDKDILHFLKKLQITGSMLVVNLHHNPVIILNPNFILDALKCIITDPKFTSGFKERQRWNAFAKTGKLPFDDLHALWKNETSKDFSENEETIKLVMETFGLLAKPILDDGCIDYYVVPCMLQEADPESLQPLLTEPDIIMSPALCFRFEQEYIPHAIWDKLIATCIHRFHCMDEPIQDQSLFVRRRFVCLAVDYMWNIILNCRGNAMKVIMFKRDKNHSLDQEIGINIRNILEYFLRKVLEMNRQTHLTYKFCLHNDYRFLPDEKMVEIENLLKASSLQCLGASGRGWISLEDYNFWFFKTGTRRKRQPDTAEILVHALPERKPSPKEIGRIAKLISGRGYQVFFVELNVSVHVLDQIMEETRNLAFRTSITKTFLHVLNTRLDIGFPQIVDAMQKHGMPYASLLASLDTNCVEVLKGLDLSKEVLKTPISNFNKASIAKCISAKSYYNLFLDLGMDYKDIDRFDVDYQMVGDRMIALLELWIRNEGSKATVEKLLLAMMECDMDVKSLSDRILSPVNRYSS
ncbi:uncharacterized protein LOC132544682 [Ylistrum balloti]|uniref:uncharacterized protein LOC132544682 n=1 Tax=Ylistrum balloti TaxID=509963 RepID=UPI00290589C0|nr:uncharacterized protein LOC132544682 [Ylistrum balloti]